ncbi:hypothetical protein Q1695_013037 [Nippostrongylus brasiliensis]|nr:hypothetical protein Q1695_013037 [Nippostrongylus brasiliensis]
MSDYGFDENQNYDPYVSYDPFDDPFGEEYDSRRPIEEDPAFDKVVGTSASQSTVPTASSKAGSSSAASSKFEDVVLQVR